MLVKIFINIRICIIRIYIRWYLFNLKNLSNFNSSDLLSSKNDVFNYCFIYKIRLAEYFNGHTMNINNVLVADFVYKKKLLYYFIFDELI